MSNQNSPKSIDEVVSAMLSASFFDSPTNLEGPVHQKALECSLASPPSKISPPPPAPPLGQMHLYVEVIEEPERTGSAAMETCTPTCVSTTMRFF